MRLSFPNATHSAAAESGIKKMQNYFIPIEMPTTFSNDALLP